MSIMVAKRGRTGTVAGFIPMPCTPYVGLPEGDVDYKVLSSGESTQPTVFDTSAGDLGTGSSGSRSPAAPVPGPVEQSNQCHPADLLVPRRPTRYSVHTWAVRMVRMGSSGPVKRDTLRG